MTGEEWRPIPGFTRYQASSEGRIRSHVRDPLGQPMALLLNPANRYLTAGPTPVGGKQKWVPVHVLVALAFHGERPHGMEVRHLDGDRLNNRADNLAWGTHAENMQDAVRHGTISRKLADRTHCLHGHEFNEKNTHRDREGARRCRVCDREQTALRRARRRNEIAAARLEVAA